MLDDLVSQFKHISNKIDSEYLANKNLKDAHSRILELEDQMRDYEVRTIHAEYNLQVEQCFTSKYKRLF